MHILDVPLFSQFMLMLLSAIGRAIPSVRRKEQLDLLADFQEAFLVGHLLQQTDSPHEEQYVDLLTAFCRRHPSLLPRVLSRTVECDPRMRKVIAASIFNIDNVERALLNQNLHFKVGGRIPQSKWRNHFAPSLSNTVMFSSTYVSID